MDWKNLDSRTKRMWVIIIAFAIPIAYFSLAVAGIVPDDYNVIEQVWGNDTADNSTATTQSQEYSETEVTGIPETVNVTANPTSSYTITFRAMEDSCDDFSFRLETLNSLTNATISITDADFGWTISPYGDYARYEGEPLYPYETTTLTLTIEGDEFTRPDSVMVICSSNGLTKANAGTVDIYS